MLTRDISLAGKKAQGIEIALPHASLVLAIGSNGYVMCGYLNMEAAEKFNDCAAIVKGVKTVDDLLAGRVVMVSAAARARGIEAGMTGAQALERML